MAGGLGAKEQREEAGSGSVLRGGSSAAPSLCSSFVLLRISTGKLAGRPWLPENRIAGAASTPCRHRPSSLDELEQVAAKAV